MGHGKSGGSPSSAWEARRERAERILRHRSHLCLLVRTGDTTGIIAPDGSASGKIGNHQFFTRVAETVIRLISAPTEDRMVFRVDTRLRPEGEGDLVSSLRSYEIYYESWGKTWERAALIKARPIADD